MIGSGIEHVLRVEVSGLTGRVLLGGFTVFLSSEGSGCVASFSLTPWILGGAERLEAWLAPAYPDGPEGPDEDREEPSFRLELHRVPRGGKPWGGTELFGYRWDEGASSLRPYGYGFARVVRHELVLRAPERRWAWEAALPFEPRDRPAVEALLGAVHGALAARDTASLLQAFGLKLAELAEGLDLPRERVAGDFVEQLGMLFAEADWRMEPLDTRDLRLDLAAGGRVVHVTAPDGGPILRGGAGGARFELPVSVSRIEGTYRIVR